MPRKVASYILLENKKVALGKQEIITELKVQKYPKKCSIYMHASMHASSVIFNSLRPHGL